MLVLSACSSSIKNDVQLSGVRDSVAVMKSYDVTTLISDSGITRYRVMADEWLVYDKTARPCWLFPKGLHMQQFDENLQVHSEVSSKYAVYYVNEERWILTDSVKAMNVDGEIFETHSLQVEQKEDLIHTDEFVRITQKERIISGIGMRSNQRLTRYTILQTQGIIPIDDEDSDVDTTQVSPL